MHTHVCVVCMYVCVCVCLCVRNGEEAKEMLKYDHRIYGGKNNSLCNTLKYYKQKNRA